MKNITLVLAAVIGLFFLGQQAVIAQQHSKNIKSINSRDALPGFMKSDLQPFRPNNFLKAPGELKQKLDSLITEEFSETGKQWLLSGKEEYKYDSKGNHILITELEWDDNNGQWQMSHKVEFGYDNSGNLVYSIYYSWNNEANQWDEEEKMEISYDFSGNAIMAVESEWDDGQWKAVYKEENTYDGENNNIERHSFEWNETSAEWENYSKVEWTFDDNGDEVSLVYYEWDQQWIENFKEEYAYDSFGNLISEIFYGWNNNQWEEDYKSEFEYNANNKLTLKTDYVWEGAQWVEESKKECENDEHNNRIEEINYYRDEGIIIPTSKIEYTYNNEYTTEELLMPLYILMYGVPLEHMPVSYIYFGYDQETMQWAEEYHDSYYYSETDVDGIPENTFTTVKIFPNPFPTSTTIEYHLYSPETITITFYNQLGKQVDRMEQKHSAGKQQVVWTPEQPNGIYFYRLQAGKQVASGKLVLMR